LAGGLIGRGYRERGDAPSVSDVAGAAPGFPAGRAPGLVLPGGMVLASIVGIRLFCSGGDGDGLTGDGGGSVDVAAPDDCAMAKAVWLAINANARARDVAATN